MKSCGAQLNRFVPPLLKNLQSSVGQRSYLSCSLRITFSLARQVAQRSRKRSRPRFRDHQSSGTRPGRGKRSTRYRKRSGTVALSNDEVIASGARAFADGGNRRTRGRPTSPKSAGRPHLLDIAKFLATCNPNPAPLRYSRQLFGHPEPRKAGGTSQLAIHHRTCAA